MASIVHEIVFRDKLEIRLAAMHAYKNTGVTSDMKTSMQQNYDHVSNHVDIEPAAGKASDSSVTRELTKMIQSPKTPVGMVDRVSRMIRLKSKDKNASLIAKVLLDDTKTKTTGIDTLRKIMIQKNKEATVLTPYHFFTADGGERTRDEIKQAFVRIHNLRATGVSIQPVAVEEAITYCIKMRKKMMMREKRAAADRKG